MKTPLAAQPLRRIIAWLVMVSMTLTQTAQVAALTLANTPLAATTTAVVRPNLMYVLDDSGSMGWDYTPDYVNDATVTDPTNAGVGPPGTSGDTGQVTLSGGSVTAITALGANSYYETPSVVIEGGGGTGAAATATWNASTKKITAVTVTAGGSGYTSAPYVTFVGKLAAAAWGMCWGTTGTSNQGGTPKDTSASPQCTTPTQIPYAAASVNYQYYDPAVRYEVPRKAAWTASCVAGDPSCYYPNATPTAASSDGFLNGATKNLTNAWPHEVWCNSSTAAPSAADPTAGGKCRENLDTSGNTLYPNVTYTFRKTYSGPAFYYTMAPAEFCTDDSYTNCVRSTAPTVVGVAPNQTTFNVPSNFRWCAYYNPKTHSFGGCQGRRDWSHYIPNYLGGWVSTGDPGVQATANLTIASVAAGQSITGLNIGGIDVIGGTTIVANGASTTSTVAQSLCAAIQANTDTTGYSCAPSGGSVVIQAAMVGTAANGLAVVASGPADVAAVNSTGEIRVLGATTGYRIDSIAINRTNAMTAQLIGDAVVATANCGGSTGLDCGSQAQLVCQAINSGPNQGVYIARSGDPGAPPAWGICGNTVDAWIGIKRIPADALDNLATIAIAAPVAATVTTGTITVNATGGATRLSDITQGGVSILTSKPLDYADGTLTTAIAADIASKIAVTGCTATASQNVVSITGSCTGALAVAAVGTAASGTFRVSSTGSTNAATLGGIRVNTADLVGNVSAAQITDGSAAATNAATLRALVGGGFTAAAPVAAGGGAYDVTVTAPVGNSYNGLSFTFLAGTASAGGPGSQPQWVFPITGATADNAHLTSITCGGTTAVPDRNTGSTSSSANWVQNLAVGTNGFNGRTVAGPNGNYTYSCSNGGMTAPAYRCTLTGPTNAAACSPFTVAPTAGISATNNGLITAGATNPVWTFNLSGASAEPKAITALTCDGTAIWSGAASTLSGSGNHILNLSNGLVAAGANGYSFAKIAGASGSGQRIEVTGPTGSNSAQPFCTTSLAITKDPTITLSSTAPVKTTTGSAYASGSQAQYSFSISNATTDSRTIRSLKCGSTCIWENSAPQNCSSDLNSASAPSTGTTSAPNGYATALANSLLNSSFDPDGGTHWYQTGATASTCSGDDDAGTVSCSFGKENSPCTQAPEIVFGTGGAAGLTLNSGPSLSGTVWSFVIGGATAANKTVTAIRCPEATGGSTATTTTTGSATAGDGDSTERANLLSANIIAKLDTAYWQTSSTCAKNSSDNNVTCTLKPVAGSICTSTPTVNDSGLDTTVTASGSNWRVAISSISDDNAVTSITCPTPNTTTYRAIGSTASTGSTVPTQTTTQRVQRLNNLRTGLNAVNFGGYSFSCGSASNASPAVDCTMTGPIPTGTAPACTMMNGGTITQTQPSLVAGTGSASAAGAAPKWRFDITASTTDNRTIGPITCAGNATDTLGGATANSGSSTLPVETRLNNLADFMVANPVANWTITKTQAATAAPLPATLSVTGPLANTNCSWLYTKDAEITASIPAQTAGTGTGTPQWSFDITNATADNLNFGALSCGGTSLLPSPSPNTGATPATTVYQRINNLTGSNGVASGSLGPTNGYTLVCQPATASSAQPSCTLTGPVGLAACNAATLVFNKDSSIGVGAVTFNNGSATSSAVDNFYVSDGNALSTAAPFGTGRAPQGATAFGVTGVGVGPIATSATAMTNGTPPSALAIPTNATGTPPNVLTMGGGQAADTATNHWTDLGIFKRVDVVSTNNTYGRASGRTDCVAATCTYNEEMQNFANWYTYYRTRMQMMKSATSVAFSQLDGNYRVGYDNICQATGTTVRERVGQFVDTGGETANQRSSWWANLTGSSPSCATPLRAETAKIGRYYAGKLAASGDPLQYSCQQNFMMLVTDGYWNENEPAATSITGTDIGNFDHDSATAPRPYYDGAQSSTTTVATGSGRGSSASSFRTLADITQYYYATDLRSSAKEVHVTTATNHGMTPGQKVTISGVVSTPPAGDANATFNGDVVAYVRGPAAFRYVPTNDLVVNPTNDPGTYVSGGTVSVNGTNVVISAATVNSGLFGNATNTAGLDVATNNVMTSVDDTNGHQHMNFYAMGLGIDGTLEYRSDYQTATSGDFKEITSGTTVNGVTTYRNWPAVANLDPTGVDDLWHATVNGRGKYFSARNLPNVVAGLREALTKIGARVGSAAAATSNLQPVSGDNFAYVGSYGTQDWVGDLQSRSIDLSSGEVSSSTACSPGATPGCQWSAQAKLDNMTWSARRIYLKPTSGTSGDPLRLLVWGNLSGGEQAWFNPSSLSQYNVLAVSNASDITGENLVNFLRGNRSLEQDGNVSHAQIWRSRAHVLGDIVNTQPIYMKAPSRTYTDAGYAAFKSSGAAATRKPVVFVASQDGFLHAFNANQPNPALVGDTGAVTVAGATVQPGEEMWAYAPQQALQNMKVLADVNYSSHHRFLVDGPITVGDANFGGGEADWHTILIGGHGAGGTAYFALDVTDPLNPKFLWEFTDTHLGYTFSNPVVSKLPNGEWAVLFTSGYNNNSGGGDGVGRLYALDPKTGAIKTGFPKSTSSGTVGTPSNLGKISVWVDNATNNNTAKFVYAGDTNGDLWRFDFDPGAAGHSGAAVFKLAHLTDPAGVGQPITTKVELTTQMTPGNDPVHVVYVGTGQYLEAADLTNTDVQSFYAIKDPLGADNLGNGSQETWTPRTASKDGASMFLKRKLIAIKEDGTKVKYTDEFGQLVDGRNICPLGDDSAQPTVTAGGACKPGNDADGNPEAIAVMDWDAYGGWMTDLPDLGERLNVDPRLKDNTIVFASNVPSATACTNAGAAWINSFDAKTGLAVTGESVGSRKVSNALVVGITLITLPSGATKAIVTKSNYQQESPKVPINTVTSSVFQNKRGLWREFEAY